MSMSARFSRPAGSGKARTKESAKKAYSAAVYALCFADPFAWMAADAVLLVPFLRNIMKMDYRYLKGTM